MKAETVTINVGESIGSPVDILDTPALRKSLNAALKGKTKETDLRAAAVPVLLDAYQAGRDRIAAALKADPYDASNAIKAYCYLTDQIVCQAIEVSRIWMHPKVKTADQISVMAVGGYGRGEMAPFSDVDLLFLSPKRASKADNAFVESILYILWDLRLKVGHAVRTIDECLTLGREDITIRTTLLEHRYLAGDKKLAQSLDDQLWTKLFDSTGPEFVEAKLEERDARHLKNGGARYVVEPNVKEGKGGLRDLQTLFWIAKYLYHVDSPEALIERGVYTADEYQVFADAEAFLWTTRCHLHLCAGRATEQLTFDMQVEVARALGFEDSHGRRAVEFFMQQYFRHANHVGELTRIFLAVLEAEHVKHRPSFGRSILNAITFSRDPTADGYVLDNGRLNIADPEVFLKNKLNFLKIFDEALKSDILIHPDAMRLIARNLDLIDDKLRNDPEANRIFLDLLVSRGNPERALRRMNEIGVLGAFIPEFERIVAMMQFNMYHSYTVDEHIIQCVSNLAQIEHGELKESLPVASSILAKGVDRKVLYVAMLLHDIGKGLPEDHSIAGAKIVETLAPRLGLDEDESETVVWLVRNHLLMSDVAQKRDLSDPRTVRDFAQAMGRRTRLKLLTVLTVCDIRGVGPGVWNNWKAALLRDLYSQTRILLRDGEQAFDGLNREDTSKDELAKALTGWKPSDVKAEQDRHYRAYWLGLDTETHKIFAELIKQAKPDEPVSHIEPDSYRDATRACFVMPDHPGIFARFAGALALAGANVVDARTYTSSDGLATAVFWIQDIEGKPYDETRLKRLQRMISRTLKGEVIARDELKSKNKIKKREREFIVPTTITFDNEGSDIFTIIEVDTRDRIGLIFDLTRTMTDCNISISSAIIATYGEQAVDAFYVKDLFGHKIHSKSRQETIEKRLMDAIAKGQESAAT